MDSGAWQAPVYGVARLGYGLVTKTTTTTKITMVKMQWVFFFSFILVHVNYILKYWANFFMDKHGLCIMFVSHYKYTEPIVVF